MLKWSVFSKRYLSVGLRENQTKCFSVFVCLEGLQIILDHRLFWEITLFGRCFWKCNKLLSNTERRKGTDKKIAYLKFILWFHLKFLELLLNTTLFPKISETYSESRQTVINYFCTTLNAFARSWTRLWIWLVSCKTDIEKLLESVRDVAKTPTNICKTSVLRKPRTPNFPKKEHFSPPDKNTHVCVSGGKKCSFFGKFGVLYFLETPVLRFALLLYYRRTLPKRYF